MSDGGKGSGTRPPSVPMKQFDNNWDSIFGKKKSEEKPATIPDKQERNTSVF
jgi:hypothetical protein